MTHITFQVTFKMCYSKCGLCHQNLEVIKSASGIAYIRCSNWKECPFWPNQRTNECHDTTGFNPSIRVKHSFRRKHLTNQNLLWPRENANDSDNWLYWDKKHIFITFSFKKKKDVITVLHLQATVSSNVIDFLNVLFFAFRLIEVTT